MSSGLTMLLVEDNDADAEALLRAVKRLNIPLDVRRCATGRCALDYLKGTGQHATGERPRPSFILLDCGLPDVSGREVLDAIKADAELKTIPVVAFSGSVEAPNVTAMYEKGASSFVAKPPDFDSLQAVTSKMMNYWMALVLLPDATESRSGEATPPLGAPVPS